MFMYPITLSVAFDAGNLRKQPTFREVATCIEPSQNDVWVTSPEFHTDDVSLPRSWECFWLVGIFFQPIRRTTKIWVVTRHQYGIFALVTQTPFWEGSSGDLAKRRLFSQATIVRSHCLLLQSYQLILEANANFCSFFFSTVAFYARLVSCEPMFIFPIVSFHSNVLWTGFKCWDISKEINYA